MTAPRRTLRNDDSGAMLILALIIVTVVALVVGALLSFGDTSLRTTMAVRDQASTAATADAGAQAALNTLRRNSFNNDSTSSTVPHCFGTGTDETTPGVWLKLADVIPGSTSAGADTALVKCEPEPGTGVDGGLVPISGPQKPGNAILTLGQVPGEDGLNVKALNTTLPFSVRGGIVSNSNINVTSGSLQTTSTAYAHTGCAGTISATQKKCDAPTLADPNYPKNDAAVPPYTPVPANVAASCPGGVVTFTPGYYDDAAALSDLMSGNGACKHSVWWFRPGDYYFDFQNTTGTHQWLVKDGQLIAGTPTGSTPSSLTPPPRPAVVPGACENPIHNDHAVGVQFVFGGDSQLQIAGSADAEICGTYYADKPFLAVYGLKDGVASPTTATNLTATTVAGPGFTPTTGTTPAAAIAVANDGKSDTWTATKSNDAATLTLSPFVAAPGIPAGSNLSSAKLRIVYGGSAAAADRTVVVTPSSSAGAGVALPSVDVPNKKSPQPANTTQTVDLTSQLAPSVHDKGLTGLSVAYTAKMSSPDKEVIDAVFLDLTYTVPTFRGETTAAVPGNCLAKPYSGGSGGQCAVLSTSSAYSGHFYIEGTTYTPVAPIDLTLSNITQQVMRFGVISRSLWLKETGAVSYIGPVIEIPNDSLGYGLQGTVAALSVYVCPPGTPCTAASHPARPSLVARVFIKEPDGNRRMLVQSWAVQR